MMSSNKLHASLSHTHRLMCGLVCLQEVMSESVIAADGHSYERHAMEHWLCNHTTSPVSGLPLKHARLVPNILIRNAIASQQYTI